MLISRMEKHIMAILILFVGLAACLGEYSMLQVCNSTPGLVCCASGIAASAQVVIPTTCETNPCCTGSVAAADPCGSMNFFPTAAQITGSTTASVAVNEAVTCRGSQVCNWPSVLNKTAQEAYQTELGTSIAAGGLLNVAVKEYGAKQLRLFFRPVSPLLTQGANAMSCVLAKTPAATRKLTQAATYSVTKPGTWSYTTSLSSGGAIAGGEHEATATGDLTLPTEGTDNVSTVDALTQSDRCALQALVLSSTHCMLCSRHCKALQDGACTSAMHAVYCMQSPARPTCICCCGDLLA